MGWVETSSAVVLGVMSLVGFNGNANASVAQDRPAAAIALEASSPDLSGSTIVDLNDLTANPSNYDFFNFRPNLEKLILSGAADTQHISILWYTVPDGSVGRHYHSMTESVYTISGTQTDAKGTYPTGSIYFNPPGSGHEVANSTGFFLLAYAAPPDFANTALIEEYTPVQINTADAEFETLYPFEPRQEGVSVYPIPLDPQGGLRAEFIKSTSAEAYQYTGNYLLVLRGSCAINGTAFAENMLVVATTIEAQAYNIEGVDGSACLALGLSF